MESQAVDFIALRQLQQLHGREPLVPDRLLPGSTKNSMEASPFLSITLLLVARQEAPAF